MASGSWGRPTPWAAPVGRPTPWAALWGVPHPLGGAVERSTPWAALWNAPHPGGAVERPTWAALRRAARLGRLPATGASLWRVGHPWGRLAALSSAPKGDFHLVIKLKYKT